MFWFQSNPSPTPLISPSNNHIYKRILCAYILYMYAYIYVYIYMWVCCTCMHTHVRMYKVHIFFTKLVTHPFLFIDDSNLLFLLLSSMLISYPSIYRFSGKMCYTGCFLKRLSNCTICLLTTEKVTHSPYHRLECHLIVFSSWGFSLFPNQPWFALYLFFL